MSSYFVRSLILFAFFFALALLTGCHSASRFPRNHFVFNQSVSLNSLDPVNAVTQAETWAVGQFYNGLVQTDSNMNPKPCLARSWQIGSDGLTYTFHLRSDVLFQNDVCFGGVPRRFTTDDVIYSFTRLLDPVLRAKGSWVLRGRLDAVRPFSALNDSTLIIKISKPFAPFIQILTMPYCYIVPHEAITFYGPSFMKHPVGTGPFRFFFWKTNDVLIGKRNPNYFEDDKTGHKLPYLDAFSMTQFESKKTEYLKFIQGDIDMMADIDAAFKDELLDEKAGLKQDRKAQIVLFKNTFLNTEYIGLQTQSGTLPLLNHPQFRKALAMSIDKDKMLIYLRNNVGYAAHGGFVPNGIKGFGNACSYGLPFGILESKVLLKQSGYKGEPVVLSVSTQNQAPAEFIVKCWQDIGINAHLDVLQSKAYRDKMVKGRIEAFRGSWVADYADPESFLACFYSENAAPPNYTRYKNKNFDTQYNTALQTNDEKKRQKIYRMLDSLAVSNAVIIPLFYDQSLTFIRKNISGLRINALDMIDLRYVVKD